jgi:hypothetical protein
MTVRPARPTIFQEHPMASMSRTLTTLAAVATVSLSSLAGAQALPSPTDIFDRYVSELGGKDAIRAISSVQQRGTLEMAAMGLSADVILASAAPNKMTMTMSIPGLGEIQQGFNGEVAWENNPMAGPRIAEGEELAARKASANFYESFGLYDLDAYTSVKVVEQTMWAGEEAYKVEMVRKVGPTSNVYFSKATGLFIGSQSTVVSPMGNLEVVAVASDYKSFGKVKLPTKLTQSQAGQDVVITFNDVQFDVVKDDAFALPPAIQALVKP